MRYIVGLLLLSFMLPGQSKARNVEPGTTSVAAMMGPSFTIAPLLGTSAAYLTLAAQIEYMVDSSLGVVGDIDLGLAGDIPLRLHLGARYRLRTGIPLSPYVQGQLTYGELFAVLGANLPILGGRVGVGADYFFTSQLAVGALLALDLTSTLKSRPAFYGSVDVLVMAQYTF